MNAQEIDLRRIGNQFPRQILGKSNAELIALSLNQNADKCGNTRVGDYRNNGDGCVVDNMSMRRDLVCGKYKNTPLSGESISGKKKIRRIFIRIKRYVVIREICLI